MAVTDTDATQRVEPEPAAAQDPSLSPVVDHSAVTMHSPVPKVVAQRPSAPPTIDRVERAPRGVRLAKISKTGDRVFRALASTSGLAIVLLVLFVGVFLLALALPSLQANQDKFLTSRNWTVAGNQLRFGIAGLLWTTVLSSILAMAIAVPVAVGVALCLTQYLHKRASGPVSFVVDLLAAVPSIIFGLWGLSVLGPFLAPAAEWLSTKIGWIPIFSRSVDPKGSVFVASVVLAIMILPIVTAISRDVFAQTPRDHIEAALALGATRWEVIRTAVLPYGRSGVISASMLGLGRALGETIAVMIILTTPAAGSPFSLIAANLWNEVKDRLGKAGIGLSGGQQQRLCIARAIAVEPQVILMDEPCSALDPISTLAIEDLIGELKEQYTVVIVTHNMQQAARVSDQTAFFNLAAQGKPGKLIEIGSTEKIFSNPDQKATEDYITGRFG